MVGQFMRSLLFWAGLAFFVNVVLSSPVRRSVPDFSGPCFVLSEEGSTVSRPLNVSLTDLKERTLGLQEMATNIQDFIEEEFMYSSGMVSNLKGSNWISEEEMLATDEQIEAAIHEPTEALQAHMLLLEEHLEYVSQTHSVGSLSTSSSQPAIETKKKLEEFETELKSCMCSLKIALLSAGYDGDSTITDNILHSYFLSNSSPLKNATYRTYVTMNDGVHLMNFLFTIYSEIQNSLA